MIEISIRTFNERRNGLFVFSLFMFLFGVIIVAMFDSVIQSFDLDEYLRQFPEIFGEMFGKSVISMGEFGGFITMEYFQWSWYLIIPIYFALYCSSFIAGEVESKTVDILFAYPIKRYAIVVGKYLSVTASIILLNVVALAAIYIGIIWKGIDYDIYWVVCACVQAAPFLFAFAALFTLISVLESESRKAATYSMCIVFVMFMLDTLSALSDKLNTLSYLSFMKYYDPGKILSQNIVSWGNTAALLVVTIALLGLSIYVFQKKDIL